MLTKADFQKKIQESIAAYPVIAPLYYAGDPRTLQNLDAMAAMLSMFSAQMEVSKSEPYEKTRDATVLADAAMRGIVRKGTPARVRVRAVNKGSAAFQVNTARTILDSSGLIYRVETPASVPAGGEATFEAVQMRSAVVNHVVAGSEPFYAIPIPAADDDAYLCAVAVSDSQGEFIHRTRYVNTEPGERIYHVEADDRQQVYVRFGFAGVVGVQPADGQELTLTVWYTMGEINPAYGSPFAFEYIGSPAEATVELTMDAMLLPGQNPMPMSVLRDLAKYPSVYDDNAVFLGEFAFLVRKKFPTLRFLSVWNEAAEEQARGPNLDNMNALFVACLSAAGGEEVLEEPDADSPVAAVKTEDEAGLTATQLSIKAEILAADDSYRVYFYTPVRSKIYVAVNAKVPTSYVAADEAQKIAEALINAYGENSAAAQRGQNKPLYQDVYALLRQNVASLSAAGADFTLSIAEPASVSTRPEMWRFVAADSLAVSVETVNVVKSSWGG